jgi:hypothetical protein
METYFRVTDHRTAGGVDEYGDPVPGSGSPGFHLETYRVVKRTPKGVRLQRTWGTFATSDPTRFMRDDAHKRFASPSIDEAVRHWRARKAAQRRIYAARVRHVDEALKDIDAQARQWKRRHEQAEEAA